MGEQLVGIEGGGGGGRSISDAKGVFIIHKSARYPTIIKKHELKQPGVGSGLVILPISLNEAERQVKSNISAQIGIYILLFQPQTTAAKPLTLLLFPGVSLMFL